EGECAGRATEQARTVRNLEAAHEAGNGGRGHSELARGRGEGAGLSDAENDDGGAQSIHAAFNTLGWCSRNTVCPTPHGPSPYLGGIRSGKALCTLASWVSGQWGGL